MTAARAGVLHVIGRLNGGGPAHLVAALSRRTGSAVAAGRVQEGEVEHSDLEGVEVHRIAGLGRRLSVADDARALRALTALVRRRRPALLHTHTAKGGVLGRLAAEPTRLPARVHTFHGHLLHGYFGRAGTAGVVAVERVLAARTDRLVTVGARVRDDLLAAGIGRPEQYVVVPPGIEPPAPPPRDEARRRLGLPLDRPVVVFVGRLAGIKRPELVVEAARRLPDVVVVLAGDGALRPSLQAGAPPNVRFLGWCDDVATVYGAADVVLLTSANEGMPLSLVEAAFAGVPAVTTDVGSAGEVVVDGVTGLVVPDTGEPAAVAEGLVQALDRLLGDEGLRRRTGQAARRRARDTFTVERMVEAHRALYRDLGVHLDPAARSGRGV